MRPRTMAPELTRPGSPHAKLARMRSSLPIAAVRLFLLVVWIAPISRAGAGGGPRNVLVVANENAEESLEIASYYARLRGVPAVNVCRIRTAPALVTDKVTYQAEIEAPIEACIAASPYAARIDYIVLTRGEPILAYFPDPSSPPATAVSMTALLQAMDTPLDGKDQAYGDPYDFQLYPNPYVNQDEAFAHAK